MVTKQLLRGLPEDADLRRADSLAREIFSDIASNWALQTIEALCERTPRFGELWNEVEGVSHEMLTQNLRMLERNGLVERTVHRPGRWSRSSRSAWRCRATAPGGCPRRFRSR